MKFKIFNIFFSIFGNKIYIIFILVLYRLVTMFYFSLSYCDLFVCVDNLDEQILFDQKETINQMIISML